MNAYEQATNSLATVDRLEQIRMSPAERRTARASLRQAEMVAEMLMRAHADLRHVLGFVRRVTAAFSHRSKVAAVRPEPN